jgi:MFS transporter, ACS family, D-galactonate transporter
MARGASTRNARGLLGAAPMIAGGLILLLVPLADSTAARVGVRVLGSGICGGIYVVCPAMIAKFAPTAQRGAMLAIYAAIYTLAGILAPLVMGKIIDAESTPLKGFMTGFRVLSAVLIASAALGVLLLWPDTEKARLNRATAADQARARWQVTGNAERTAKTP